MKFNLSKLLYIVLFFAIIPIVSWANAEKRNFTLVIDAGHGGHDAGAVGAYSKEKDINLRVALAFGKLVEENCPDVKVIYTRRRDVFIPLQTRADIANRNKADLFVSIHTNALPAGRLAYGSETYTLGMARANANLAVAKRENSVITLESNYKSTYQGFDPNKAESYVIFEFMQDKFMKQSVDLASAIQKQYTHAGRPNKGVHQAGFLVLRNTSMPSVLTELGFITTPAEEAYLNSERGTTELSRSIYNGFLTYRRMHEHGANDIPQNLPTNAEAEIATPVAQPNAEPNNDRSQKPVNTGEVAVVPVTAVPTARIIKEGANNELAEQNVRNHQSTRHQQTAPESKPNRVVVQKVETPKPAPTPKPKEVKKEVEKPKAPTKTVTKPVATTSNKQTAKDTQNKATHAKDKKAVNTKETAKNDKSVTKGKEADKTKSKQSDKNKTTSSDKNKATATKTKVNDAKGKQDDKKKQNTANKKSTTTTAKVKVTYRIQVGAGKAQIDTKDAQFKGLNVNRVKEGSMNKYFYGTYRSYAEAQKALKIVKTKISAAYIVAYVGGKAVSVAEARSKE